jgi:hypothetical protein
MPDQVNARVFIDDVYVKDAAWEYTVPRPGQSVIVRAIPMGGGGESGGGKDVITIVAMVVILGAAIALSAGALGPAGLGLAGAYLAAGSTSALLAAGTLSIVSSLALTGLIPRPLPHRLPLPLNDRMEVAE